ncbi:Wzz/FepE/Etk N-terminal domain-containing protein [Stutzerimonas nitrititolerans]|uniref:Wzz/FepE/Etk N-terminal domain-containing protein n=1 Tax=Stutzerimonas nitrititolerans TaxID=2482751 RepID=UPI0035E3F106
MIVPQQPNATDEIDLVELFRALWRQKLLIIGVTLIIMVIAAAYASGGVPTRERH